MIFLFEQVAYKTSFLEAILPLKGKGENWNIPKGFVQKESNETSRLDGVGYFYSANSKFTSKNENISDKLVFVLPKVFLSENDTTAFGQVIPKDTEEAYAFGLNIPKEFLASLSMWVCSSIAQYRKTNPNDKDIEAPNARDFNGDKQAPTLIDVMNAMKEFYNENQNLVVFTAKNKHSGNNRIDWRRTVVHTQPFMQGGSPIYMDLENKKKVFDLDDRLLVLFFSAMNYIEETFGFKMPKSEFYTPMRVNEFRRLLGHRGLMEMRRIKHKYFADKFLKLFNIVKAFFEWGANFSANNFESEYLLTSKYNNVFEAMIDKLVGDPEFQELKNNEDGKIIDHLYKEDSLIFASGSEKIWHIGDSKYYKDNSDFDGSIAKQFTYAKNMMQDFFSPDYIDGRKNHNSDEHRNVRYRDDLTEGYNVTPNFFIRGEIPKYCETFQFTDPFFRPKALAKKDDNLIRLARKGYGSDEVAQNNLANELWAKRNRHFANRLFDRDTLLLQAYDVNFLYVLKAYTSKHSSFRDEFRKKTRQEFRENFMMLLNQRYYFWAVYLPNWENPDYTERLKIFVNDYFRSLVGRVFQSKDTPHCLILALERQIVDDSRRGTCINEEFEKIRQIIDDEQCEVFSLLPQDIWNCGDVWNDTKLRYKRANLNKG